MVSPERGGEPFPYPSGTRVVVRFRLPDGRATDALGWVHLSDATHCVVATARGLETIELATVIAAREVPPPPPPRHRRGATPAPTGDDAETAPQSDA